MSRVFRSFSPFYPRSFILLFVHHTWLETSKNIFRIKMHCICELWDPFEMSKISTLLWKIAPFWDVNTPTLRLRFYGNSSHITMTTTKIIHPGCREWPRIMGVKGVWPTFTYIGQVTLYSFATAGHAGVDLDVDIYIYIYIYRKSRLGPHKWP